MDDCLFCKIIKSEIPSKFLHEDDTCIIIKDKFPQSPTHILIIPKKHIPSLAHVDVEHKNLLGNCLIAGQLMMDNLGFGKRGYRTVINTGSEGGQSIFHLHFHFLAGKVLGESQLIS